MIEVYFATNRDLEAKSPPRFGNEFHKDGPHTLRYGRAEVKKTRGKYKVDKVHLAEEKIPESAKEAPILGSKAIYEALRARMADEKRDVLCLIHGYASTFESALERAAELQDKYGKRGNLQAFVFSWPANGRMVPWLDYYDDRDDARASALAIARSFPKLRDFLLDLGREQRANGQRRFCQQSIHVVAHSMGNYALRHALQEILRELGHAPPRVFDNVFLMAADEDDDAFEHDHKLRLLPRLAKAVHVYYASNDRALVISDTTKGNPDRLGSEGPRLREGIPRKVTLVDCQDVVDLGLDDLSLHQYYRLADEVVADVRHVLAGRAPSEIPNRATVPDDRGFRLKPKKAKRAPRKPREPRGR